MYDIVEKQAFKLAGISVRTINADGQSVKDIRELAQKFFGEDMLDNIPNQEEYKVFFVYTDYEHDHNGSYTVYMGCRVSSYEGIEDIYEKKDIAGGKFAVFKPLTQEMDEVMGVWHRIWRGQDGLKRRYAADYDVHSVDSIEICLSIE